MKPNNITEQKIGLTFIGLFIFLFFIFICFFIDSSYPDIKHKILFSNITLCVFIIVIIIIFILLCKRKPLSKFKKITYKWRVLYALIYLILSFGFIWCIEYLIYLNNKDQFNIESEYIENSIRNKEHYILSELEYYQHFKHSYSKLVSEILSTNKYELFNINDDVLIPLQSDTLIVHFNRISPMVPSTPSRKKREKINYEGARSLGISLKEESHNLSHPSSTRQTLEFVKKNGYIEGKDLINILNQKIKFYNQRCLLFENLLENNQYISFTDFLIYNAFNYSTMSSGMNVIIRFLILIQTVIITFGSGYIFKNAYNWIDND